jgi:acetolactate synthase small subunit
MAWVIECLLIGEFDSSNAINSDEILYKTIEEAKRNLLELISTYRVNNEEEEESLENELDIIKLILISVKSKYAT